MIRRCIKTIEEPGEEPGYTRFADCPNQVYRWIGSIPVCADHYATHQYRGVERTPEEYDEFVLIEELVQS